MESVAVAARWKVEPVFLHNGESKVKKKKKNTDFHYRKRNPEDYRFAN